MATSVTRLVHFPFLFLFLILLPINSNAQTYKNISSGSSLTAGDADTSWPSQSGDFAFGFRQILQDNQFLLAIWFNKIPDKTIVWFANDADENNREIQIRKGSRVELTTDGKLILNDPQGNELWSAGKAGGADYAAMLDNGNFVLGSRSSAELLWESFKDPTDTILPTQVLKVNGSVYSRETKDSYSKGRFRLRMLPEGKLVLNVAAYPSSSEFQYDEYYPNNNDDSQKEGYEAVFNQSGYIYVNLSDGTKRFLSTENLLPISDVYYRATLDFDGVFTQYSHPRSKNGEQVWSTVWSIPDNICVAIGGVRGAGACGYNSYCRLTSDRRPHCKCPPKFSFVDPNNTYGGCRPDFLQGCQLDEWKTKTNSFELQTLDAVDWPTSDYEELGNYDIEECKTSCLSDCLCDVAIFRNRTCWKKKLPLSNGRENGDTSMAVLIKVRKANLSEPNCFFPQPPDEINDRSTLLLVVSLLLGSSILFNFIFLARALYLNSLAFLVCFFSTEKKLRGKAQDSSVSRSSLRSFTYQELEEATNGFKDELGRGAFGIVYKGLIEEMDSTRFIAVKRLDKVLQEGEKEFKTEVNSIGRTHHKNLVQLFGFCEEGQQRLLVYEFMSNKSLADHLFGNSKPDWKQRVQIALGISRGLLYLHEECSTQIIHCDIKPQNILLDDSFTAKISDFGLAKLLMTTQSRISTITGIRGTKGYVAPEWFRNTPVSAKVDVYSFGVMLLEIICCRKGVFREEGEEDMKAILTDWAYYCFSQGKLEDLVEDDEEVMNDMRRFERLVMVAIWCIQDEPSLRPSMKRVMQMLEGVLEVPVPPCPYQFNTHDESYSEPDYV
ncbi:hypothetical protein C5167_041590 [Papaver somniferum]|uniref:G-type lectin S-receptor-like serine/threonine-protein kinase LECRK4 n=1 Tax=Papaver somniferum TaxID=3469 RepID=UPI000E6FC34E|nr:G-type lectin S-receptor-like serine/threonine-protein kinase LECRK4 [Papaver somniferum]RZC85406.1 hypothetical protein C5167_041590 [Papaver somniferum]